MDFVQDRSEAGELLERFAEFLEQGLPYGAAFLAAAWRCRFDPGATLSFMARQFESGLVPCSALLEPLVDADLVDVVRRGEQAGDVVASLRVAADVARGQ
jgi:hypothetical protein